jgi:hypothetical protein
VGAGAARRPKALAVKETVEEAHVAVKEVFFKKNMRKIKRNERERESKEMK